jgi:hypothetical protein
MKRAFSVVALCSTTALAVNCDISPTDTAPLAPTSVVGQSSQFASTTHGIPITAILGTGSGSVNVTPTAAVDGSFSAQITVNVHGVAPNTTLYVQRAPEIGRANSADGVCQRADGLPPWGDVSNFITFTVPGSGSLTLETSPGGSGAVHMEFAAPTITDGTRFDVMFRLVDNLSSTPGIELRSACFTVTVK